MDSVMFTRQSKEWWVWMGARVGEVCLCVWHGTRESKLDFIFTDGSC